ncbi:MAG: glutamyl-tRNA reductase [Cardiobacteriaceae bacterium]|nr:glutamyl-tRNA reductase [Cardiobacteriaceae bacterium]
MLNSECTQVKSIFAFGISHQTANTRQREKLAFSPEMVARALKDGQESLALDELAILATCNRTEFYAAATHTPDFVAWLARFAGMDEATLNAITFCHEERDAVRHMYRVACGLDSLILGEPQILGQLKQAYRLAKLQGSVGSMLDRLFQQSFAIAKQVRHSTAIGENPVSVAFAGVKLTHRFFDDHHRRTALVIGAGDTGQLCAKYLRDLNIGRLIIANRTLANAQTLAEETGGFAIGLGQIAEHLHDADLIFGTARTDVALITGDQAKMAMKRRKQMQVFVDLGIPRNFSTDVNDVAQAFLFGIDDLEQILDHNREARKSAAREAELMVKLYSDDFIGWLHSRPQQQLVRRIRENGENIRVALLQEAYRRLAHGDDPAAILEQMSYKLTRKLLHSPSAMIHAIPPDHKDWLAIIADTFTTDAKP